MDSFRATTINANNDKDIRGYRRRPHSLIERRLGSQFESVENLLPFERYHNWASLILKEIPHSKEMEITRAWLEFIHKNRNVPVMYDFIRLFVFSLHLCYRVRPFDAIPTDALLNQQRFDVVKAGRILISRLVALEQKMRMDGDFASEIQRRDRHYSKCTKPTYGKTNQPQRFFPLIHIANNKTKNTKEYFATQGIPGFGRHCWYTIADDRQPYYYDRPSKPRNRKDILGRLADHINNMEMRKERPLTERDIERFKLTTRDWWNWRDPHHPYASRGPVHGDGNFQWYKHSNIMKGSNYKLDKKHIRKIMDDEFKEVTLGYRPIPRCVLRNVLGLDIDDSSFSNVKLSKRQSRSSSTSARRASVSKWLDDLDLSVSQEIPETRDQHFSPGSSFQKSTPSPCPRSSTPSPSVRRRTSSPSTRQSPLLPTPRRPLSLSTPKRSPCSPCPKTPPPCPRTPSPCPRTSSPCPRTPSPCPRTPSPCPRKPSPCPRKPSPCPRTPSPCPKRTPSPCPKRSSTPVFDTESNIYSEDAIFAREITERIGDPNGPPEMVNAAIGGWLDQLESSLQDLPPTQWTPRTSKSPSFPRPRSSFPDSFTRRSTRFGGSFKESPSGIQEEFFGPSEGFSSESWGEPIQDDTYPDVIESEQDFADEMAQFEAQTGAGWAEKSERSLDFEDAKELSFGDQFLLPTADVQFDEDAQEAANPFGGFDDAEDDWVAPPEIPPCEEVEQVVPLPTTDAEAETENRRAGKLFMPQPQKAENTADLERISWPDRTHLYDINTDFPKTDKPFDFLDYDQLRNVEDMGDVCEEIPEEDGRWLNLADIADQLGQK